jgi:hypothetical protein
MVAIRAYREIPDDRLRRRTRGKEGRSCLPITIQKIDSTKRNFCETLWRVRGSFKKLSSEKHIPLSKVCTATSPEQNKTLDEA